MYKLLYDPLMGVAADPLVHRQMGLDPYASLRFPQAARVSHCTDSMEVFELADESQVLVVLLHAVHTREIVSGEVQDAPRATE